MHDIFMNQIGLFKQSYFFLTGNLFVHGRFNCYRFLTFRVPLAYKSDSDILFRIYILFFGRIFTIILVFQFAIYLPVKITVNLRKISSSVLRNEMGFWT